MFILELEQLQLVKNEKELVKYLVLLKFPFAIAQQNRSVLVKHSAIVHIACGHYSDYAP